MLFTLNILRCNLIAIRTRTFDYYKDHENDTSDSYLDYDVDFGQPNGSSDEANYTGAFPTPEKHKLSHQ